MSFESPERIIRDPLWNTIRLDPTAVRIVDTSDFQRQRYIRQLGFAHLVYPGATHTRFGHAVGVSLPPIPRAGSPQQYDCDGIRRRQHSTVP